MNAFIQRGRIRCGRWTLWPINWRTEEGFVRLTVVDIYTRECLAIESEQRLKGEDVVLALNRIKIQRGVPKLVYCDNGSEFSSQAMDLWAYQNGVRMAFSRPGKPTDNAFVESFNGTFRSECLNAHWFTSLTEAQEIVETWRREYNLVSYCPTWLCS